MRTIIFLFLFVCMMNAQDSLIFPRSINDPLTYQWRRVVQPVHRTVIDTFELQTYPYFLSVRSIVELYDEYEEQHFTFLTKYDYLSGKTKGERYADVFYFQKNCVWYVRLKHTHSFDGFIEYLRKKIK